MTNGEAEIQITFRTVEPAHAVKIRCTNHYIAG